MEQAKDSIKIHQNKYAQTILNTFGYQDARPSQILMDLHQSTESANDMDQQHITSYPFREVLGSLMYLAVSTRPDIACHAGVWRKYASKPSKQHVGSIKKILRYIAGSTSRGITSECHDSSSIEIDSYCNSQWGHDLDTGKRTSGDVL